MEQHPSCNQHGDLTCEATPTAIESFLLNKVALDPHWTETTQVILAQHSSSMPIAAIGSYRM